MNSTFKIVGHADKALTSIGTVFFMGKPMKGNPAKGYNVLITAAHVLNNLVGDNATLILRRKNTDGTFSPYPFPIKIRENGRNLYFTHKDADVAAMYLSVPGDAEMKHLPLDFLATDERLIGLGVHPGDELRCLGYPIGVDFDTFPVIRSGLLASYPLTPSKVVKTFYYNFHIFPGNSGGPVYFVFNSRTLGNVIQMGVQQGVIGLVSQQLNSTALGFEAAQLDMGKIVPSSFIIETIALLPGTPSN